MFFTRTFCLALIFFSSAIILCTSEVQVCDFEDEECLTRGANKIYKSFIDDDDEVPSDGLYLDLIVGNLPTVKYTLSNATFSGIKDCHITSLRINEKDSTFDLRLECPFLTLESAIKTEGCLGPKYLVGSGSIHHQFIDYNYIFHGSYEQYEKDGTCYVHIKDYEVDFEAEGRVHYYCEGLYDGNQEKIDSLLKFANKFWCFIDKIIRRPFMGAFMGILIDDGNAFLKVTPIEVLFPGD